VSRGRLTPHYQSDDSNNVVHFDEWRLYCTSVCCTLFHNACVSFTSRLPLARTHTSLFTWSRTERAYDLPLVRISWLEMQLNVPPDTTVGPPLVCRAGMSDDECEAVVCVGIIVYSQCVPGGLWARRLRGPDQRKYCVAVCVGDVCRPGRDLEIHREYMLVVDGLGGCLCRGLYEYLFVVWVGKVCCSLEGV